MGFVRLDVYISVFVLNCWFVDVFIFIVWCFIGILIFMGVSVVWLGVSIYVDYYCIEMFNLYWGIWKFVLFKVYLCYGLWR